MLFIPNMRRTNLTCCRYDNYYPNRLAKSNITKQYFSHCVNDIIDGSPSRMRSVLLISFGITIRPSSSILRTMPVARTKMLPPSSF